MGDDPGSGRGRGGPLRRRRGGGRPQRARTARRPVVTFDQLADEVAAATRGGRGHRRRARRPGRRSGRRTAAEWMVAALGAVGAGAVLVPLNTRFKGDEAAYVLAGLAGPPPLHRRGIPRHRLPGDARRTQVADGELPDLERVVVLRPRAIGTAGPAPKLPTVAAGPTSSVESRRSLGGRGRGPRGLARRRRPLRPDLHLGDHRAPEGGDDHPRPVAAHLRDLVARWSVCARATATSSSTRSSTPSATRRASWPV